MIRILALIAVVAATACTAPEAGPLSRQGERPDVIPVTQDNQKGVAVTIYNGNLGLVKDIREVRLASGVQEVRFMDVASQIDPTAVHLKSLNDPAGLKVLEQNYEYDLLSPQKLLDKYVGKKVKLLDKNYYTGEEKLVEGVLLSNNGGPIYQIDGQIHLGYPGRVILPEIPGNLMAKPTLVWLMKNGKRQSHTIEASYVTGGINWKADYVMVLNEKGTKGDLSGWVTIDNKSGATYQDASLKLVDGDLNRVTSRDLLYGAMPKAAVVRKEESLEFKEEGFFEYHIYSLQGRTTIKNNQTKQINLLNASQVPINKRLIYYGAQYYYRNRYGSPVSNQKVGVYLEIANREKNHLGIPLPKGIVRVYKADKEGSLQLVGEDRIDHTPKDEEVKIKMGEAFDIVGERVQKDWRRIAWETYEVEWEIHLRNHKKEDAQVSIVEPIPGDWEILKSSHPYVKVEAHALEYRVNIPREGAVKVNYLVRVRY